MESDFVGHPVESPFRYFSPFFRRLGPPPSTPPSVEGRDPKIGKTALLPDSSDVACQLYCQGVSLAGIAS